MNREQFLKAVNDYIEAHDMSAREFSVLATRDSGFVSRLRQGKANITMKTMDRVIEFMGKTRQAADERHR
jgi:hypothetical protein